MMSQTVEKQESPHAERLLQKLISKEAKIGVIGLGYVGLPLAMSFAGENYPTTGFDFDPAKIALLEKGQSYIRHISNQTITAAQESGFFQACADYSALRAMDAILICVPTPLTPQREPDLSYVVNTAQAVAAELQPGQIVILESTTYPGTTRDIVRPILEGKSGLHCGQDFLLAYSPEREDPGNPDFTTQKIPKVVGADSEDARRVAEALYRHVTPKIIPVRSTVTAEAVKLTENIFRAVNIALVNELKVIFAEMGIDIWEVIEAAKSKPFGYMPFYPGPGLGGHCVPIDPFYLTWKAREHGLNTRFIELAGEINHAMPAYVIERLTEALNDRFAKTMKGAHILIVGIAYKRNVEDVRESPAFRLIDLIERRHGRTSYYDPLVRSIPQTREFSHLAGRQSIEWSTDALKSFDAAIICTDHSDVDYALLQSACPLIIDTRAVLPVNTANLVRA